MVLRQPILEGAYPLPVFTKDIGPAKQDPVTKSTLSDAAIYVTEDTCGRPTYVHFGSALGVNENVECAPTSAASMSVKGFLPLFTKRDSGDFTVSVEMTPGEFDIAIASYFGRLQVELFEQYSAFYQSLN